MPLNEEQVQTALQWMQNKKIKGDCPLCGAKDWGMGDIVMSPSFSDKGMKFGKGGVPMLEVICENCAHVRLFAAAIMGLV